MVNANVKIIEELKQFLNIILEDADIRNLFTTHPSDFSRNRKLPIEKLIGILINLPKRSLSIEIQSFFEALNQSESVCTKGAFSLQRIKLRPLFFKIWNNLLVENFYKYYGENIKKWMGFRLLAVDGSNVHLINKPDVVEYFGSADNQFECVPMGRAIQIHDVLNDLTLWGDLVPRKYGENTIIAQHIHCLPPDSLTLFDRGYPGYALMYLMNNEESPRHFVMRCKATFNKETKAFINSGRSSKTITITPSREAIEQLRGYGYIVTANTELRIRMVKFQLPDGEMEILLTNLYNENVYTLSLLKDLYFMRWKIETAYSKQKNQMQMEIFSGHKVVCIQQDYAAGLFVSNLQSLIEKQSDIYVKRASKKRFYNYKINRNISWSILKNRIIHIFLTTVNSRQILLELQKAFERNLEPERPGRQNRRPPRKRKRGKYQTFTNYKRAI
jgi:hypothetical protein